MYRQRLFALMKKLLPRSISFKLRYAKAEIVDSEMRALKKIATCLGGERQYAIDVGANWGIYSSVLSKSFEKVISVEPNPACAQYIKSVLNNNCTVIEAAASNKDEYINLRVPVSGNQAETTRGTISERNNFDDIEVISVQEKLVHCVRLDDVATDLLKGGARVALVKVDVEGHELEAIEGAEEILKRHKPVLFVELEQRHGTRTAELRAFTAQYGYETFVFKDDKTSAGTVEAAATSRSSSSEDAVNVIFLVNAAEQTPQQARLRQHLVALI